MTSFPPGYFDDRMAPHIEAKVINEEWPPGEMARHLDDHARIEVEARMVWEDGTEEWIHGYATRWVRPVVLVELHDPRQRRPRMWLSASDVRRIARRSPDD